MDYTSAFSLEGQIAVVTGAASGIGREISKAFLQMGANVVLLDCDEDALAKLSTELASGSADQKVLPISADVTDSTAMALVAEKVENEFGPVSILVNSAGIARLHDALDNSDKAWEDVMRVNLDGTYFASRAFGVAMVHRQRGSIVNLGSMSGTIINRPQHAASYMASKGAVHMLTKALAAEWAPFNVRVNALAPGYVATDMTLKMREQPELFNTWMEMTPMGRCGEPAEIASAALFLASPAASYVTGAILAVDGGYTVW